MNTAPLLFMAELFESPSGIGMAGSGGVTPNSTQGHSLCDPDLSFRAEERKGRDVACPLSSAPHAKATPRTSVVLIMERSKGSPGSAHIPKGAWTRSSRLLSQLSVSRGTRFCRSKAAPPEKRMRLSA